MITTILTHFAADAPECTNGGFFGLPTWYRYLKVQPDSVTEKCEVQFHLMKDGKFNGGDILLVGLSVIDILIRIAAIVAVGYVIYGGIKYITSQGSPDNVKNAQNTIMHAMIGVVVAIIAAAVVAFVGNTIG